MRLENVPVDCVGEEVGGNESVVEFAGKRTALVDDAAAGDMAALESLVRHMVEVAERVRIVQLAVLAEAFDVVGALDLMEHRRMAIVGAR